MGISVERSRAPSPLMGEGWDEGDTPHLNPLPQGERMPSPGRSDTLTQEGKDLFKHRPETVQEPITTFSNFLDTPLEGVPAHSLEKPPDVGYLGSGVFVAPAKAGAQMPPSG